MIPSINPVRTVQKSLLACPHAREAAIKSQQTRLARFEQMPHRTPEEINLRKNFLDFIISTHNAMSGKNLN